MSTSERRPRGSRLWWWIVVAFALQIAAWTAWFVVARRHPVQEVPLVSLKCPSDCGSAGHFGPLPS